MGKYRKFLVAAGAAVAQAVSIGWLDERATVLLAVLGAFGVYATPND